MIDDADRTDSPFALPGPVVLYVVVDDPDALTTGRPRVAPRSSWG